jgi:hypothetical protein
MEESKNYQNKITAGLLVTYLFVLTWIILFKMQFSLQDLRHFTDFRGINLIPFAGTVIVNLIASGAPGYHTIDFYPGIYRGEQKQPDIYLAPQLTYSKDHPGSAIPAIHLGFEVVSP